MARPALEGVIAAIPTPFDEQEDVLLPALASNVARWNETALSGYTVLGTTGEFVSLTTDEKKTVLEEARKVIPENKVFLAGTGAEWTRETVSLTRWAGAMDCDYAIVITPHYNRRSFARDALVDHYRRAADESTIPIVIYHIPACTGLSLEPETVARMAEHANIAGIKDSSGDVFALQEMKQQCRDGFAVLTGAAQIFLAALTVGVSGAILADACVAADLCVEIAAASKAAQVDRARLLQARLSRLNRVLVARHGIPGIKALLDHLGYYGGPPRRPLTPLTDEAKEEISRVFRESVPS